MSCKINVLEIDARDANMQSGIARYMDVLDECMPAYVNTYRVIFYRDANTQDVQIKFSGKELSIRHPLNFPHHTLFEPVFAMLAPMLGNMQNIIVKCNCLGLESFVYLVRNRICCKTIGIVHCMPPMPTVSNNIRTKNPFFNMDYIILVAPNGAQWLKYVNNTRPSRIIANGIPKPIISNANPQDGVFRFIFANGLSVNKGLAKIIPAIRRVAQKHKLEVMVLGGGGTKDQVFDVSDLPIKFMGYISDKQKLADIYANSDCALFASRSEACSFAGIEALAYNLPIISGRATGLTEMFDGVAKLIDFLPNGEINVEQYADAMMAVIENSRLRKKMAVLSYSRYVLRYTAGRMIQKTLKLYKQVLGI